MARARVSTTVDEHVLSSARELRAGLSDARLLDEALAALLARHRAREIDAAYAAYDERPLNEPDVWGDLASFGSAAPSREPTPSARRGLVVRAARHRDRPVVVLSRDAAIPRLRRVLVAPCTATICGLASEVPYLRRWTRVERPCVVSLDSVERVSVGMLVDRAGRLGVDRMAEVCAALEVAVDCGR